MDLPAGVSAEATAVRDAGGDSSGAFAFDRELPATERGRADAGAKIRRSALGGLWRVAVAEESMAPALRPGDWLVLDPTLRRWPRRGSVVVFREPDSGILAIKRVAAGPGRAARGRAAPGRAPLGSRPGCDRADPLQWTVPEPGSTRQRVERDRSVAP